MTGSRGPRGYSDWQRIVNWDGPVLVDLAGKEETGTFTSAALEVSRYGYLGGIVQVGLNPVEVSLQWFADKALTKSLGERLFLLDPEIVNPSAIRIPNLGPWLRVQILPAKLETKWTNNIRLIATNRFSPLEFLPRLPQLLFKRKNAGDVEVIAAFPASMYAGPMRVYIEGEGQTVRVLMESEVEQGVFRTVDEFQLTGPTTIGFGSVIAPVGAWRVQIVAAAGKATNVSLQPSVTGST